MGFLLDGAWQDVDMRTQGGQFIRKPTVFHNYVTADGSPGPTGTGGFAAERGRYHLYVSLACPWAHRTLIFRKLKKLDDVISVSVTVPLFGKTGLGIRHRARRDARHRQRQGGARRHLCAGAIRTTAAALERAGAVGQEAAHHRQQRIVRNHPHAQFGVRCVHRRAHGLLSGGAAPRDRSYQRPGLLDREQRRLSRGLRHHAGGL